MTKQKLELLPNKEQIEKALTRLQGAFPTMFTHADAEIARSRVAEYRGFFSRCNRNALSEILTTAIKSCRFAPSIADLEKIASGQPQDDFSLPEAYRDVRDFWSVWYSRCFEVAATILSESPGSHAQAVAIERLVQLFRDRLLFPDQSVRTADGRVIERGSAVERQREFNDHLRSCIEAFEHGGAESFRDYWNSAAWLLEGQREDQAI